MIGPTSRHPKETDIPDLGWIRTRNPSSRMAADPRIRARGYCLPHRLMLSVIFGDKQAAFMCIVCDRRVDLRVWLVMGD